jgi:hypothetical protein
MGLHYPPRFRDEEANTFSTRRHAGCAVFTSSSWILAWAGAYSIMEQED